MITTIDIVKKLNIRFSTIWGEKHTSRFRDRNYIEIWLSDWCDGLSGIDMHCIKHAIDYCKMNLEWPPTLAEFIKICENYSPVKIPGPEECMRLAVRRDFNNPLVKTIFDKIGSWDFGHDSEKILLGKVKKIHQQEMENFRSNRSKMIGHDTQGCEHGHEQQGISKHWDKAMRTAETNLLQ